ncbi:YueH family protein [Aeribacillus sp. FSL M8-0254]|uniref:YueH family protein n=1 Tax=Aeribacillus sp. FSL M8-0254 TaxID=2954577 RepID=UPI0030F6E887
MKVRKANIIHNGEEIRNVYIYENKKEEYILVAVPQLEWSKIIKYEEINDKTREHLQNSIAKRSNENIAISLCSKITQWIQEM